MKLYKQKSETLNVTNSTMHPNNFKVCMYTMKWHTCMYIRYMYKISQIFYFLLYEDLMQHSLETVIMKVDQFDEIHVCSISIVCSLF